MVKPNDRERKFKCPYCGECFLNAAGLGGHLVAKHRTPSLRREELVREMLDPMTDDIEERIKVLLYEGPPFKIASKLEKRVEALERILEKVANAAKANVEIGQKNIELLKSMTIKHTNDMVLILAGLVESGSLTPDQARKIFVPFKLYYQDITGELEYPFLQDLLTRIAQEKKKPIGVGK